MILTLRSENSLQRRTSYLNRKNKSFLKLQFKGERLLVPKTLKHREFLDFDMNLEDHDRNPPITNNQSDERNAPININHGTTRGR